MQNKNKDRGMIKWQPFASLPEHMEHINKLISRNVSKKKKISSDKLQEMDELVKKSIINGTKLVLILYKKSGYCEKIGIPINYDDENKTLIIINENNKKERISIINIEDVKEI